MSRQRRGVAIIGLGMAVRPHAMSLQDLSDRAEVVWAASRSEERCAAFATDFPFPTTTEIGRVLADERVEAVILLTPPASHEQLGRAVLEAGKHLLIEKPVGLTTEVAEELRRVAAQRGRRIGVVLQHRFRPASLQLGTLIAEGSLGRLCAGHCLVPWWRPQSYYDEPGRGTLARDGGGVLLTQAIHTLDLLRALVGQVAIEASLVSTTPLHRMETEDHVAALARFGAEGAPAMILATTACYPGFSERIDLIFTNATARLEGGSLDLFHQDGRREHLGEDQSLGGGADPMAFPRDSHRALIADFLAALDEDRPPAVSIEDAIASRQLIDAMLDPPKGHTRPG
jgi:predicted dehydrogenase